MRCRLMIVMLLHGCLVGWGGPLPGTWTASVALGRPLTRLDDGQPATACAFMVKDADAASHP